MRGATGHGSEVHTWSPGATSHHTEERRTKRDGLNRGFRGSEGRGVQDTARLEAQSQKDPTSCVSYPQDFPGAGAALSTVQKTESPQVTLNWEGLRIATYPSALSTLRGTMQRARGRLRSVRSRTTPPRAALAPRPEQMTCTQVFSLGSATSRSPSVTRKASAG